MKGSNRFVSSLDLKYLGAKFITIPDSHLEGNSHLSEIRRSRDRQLPSLLKMHPEYQESSLKSSAVGSQFPYDILDYQKSYKPSQVNKKDKMMATGEYSQEQKRQIAKYRSLIHNIKHDNDILHKEITNLYKEKKINDTEPKTKPIKNIFKAGKELPKVVRQIRCSPEAKEYNQIYQRLNSQENPYRSQGLEIQKKLCSSNLHKNFESFLQLRSRRVPDFIKNMR